MATWTDPVPDKDKCPMCDGKGRTRRNNPCLLCNGTGRKNA